MKVKDVMVTDLVTVKADVTVKKAVEVMNDFEIGCLIVVEKGEAIGIITERDILRRIVVEGRDPEKTLARERKVFCKKPIAGGLIIELDAFVGGNGPNTYGNECEPRRAVWIYGTNTKTPKMRADFELNAPLATGARLILTGQDDDKPGVVEIEIRINGKPVYSGPNGCIQNGWSTREFPIPPGFCTVGKNTLEIRTTKPSERRDAGWFMVGECKLIPVCVQDDCL